MWTNEECWNRLTEEIERRAEDMVGEGEEQVNESEFGLVSKHLPSVQIFPFSTGLSPSSLNYPIT